MTSAALRTHTQVNCGESLRLLIFVVFCFRSFYLPCTIRRVNILKYGKTYVSVVAAYLVTAVEFFCGCGRALKRLGLNHDARFAALMLDISGFLVDNVLIISMLLRRWYKVLWYFIVRSFSLFERDIIVAISPFLAVAKTLNLFFDVLHCTGYYVHWAVHHLLLRL